MRAAERSTAEGAACDTDVGLYAQNIFKSVHSLRLSFHKVKVKVYVNLYSALS